MARLTWFSTNGKSRHALCGRWCRQAVSPGGNGGGVADQLLHQQRHEQLAVQPGLGAVLVVLGQVPSSASDLNRLNTSSTCHRRRYHSSTSAPGNSAAGNVVNTITYLANSKVCGCTCRPLRAASLRMPRCAIRIASSVLRIAQTRPLTRSPCGATTWTGHDWTAPRAPRRKPGPADQMAGIPACGTPASRCSPAP